MADPMTSTAAPYAAGAGSVAFLSMMPGIDANAVVGSFAGALFIVVYSKDLHPLARLGYLITSWVFGYYAAVELIGQRITHSTGLAAFIGGLLCMAVSISLIEWVQGGRVPGWLQFISRLVRAVTPGGPKDGG